MTNSTDSKAKHSVVVVLCCCAARFPRQFLFDKLIFRFNRLNCILFVLFADCQNDSLAEYRQNVHIGHLYSGPKGQSLSLFILIMNKFIDYSMQFRIYFHIYIYMLGDHQS